VQDLNSEPPDAVFRLAAAWRLEAIHRTHGLGLVPLPPIVRLEGREAVRIVRGIVNGLQTGRAADWGTFAGWIAALIGERLAHGTGADSGTEAAPL